MHPTVPELHNDNCVFFQIANHDRDMTLVTQILWGRTTHVRKNGSQKNGSCSFLGVSVFTRDILLMKPYLSFISTWASFHFLFLNGREIIARGDNFHTYSSFLSIKKKKKERKKRKQEGFNFCCLWARERKRRWEQKREECSKIGFGGFYLRSFLSLLSSRISIGKK